MTDLVLHRGELGIDIGHPKLDLSIENPKIDGEWVTGNVVISASAAGHSIHKTVPFKTKNNDEEKVEFGGAEVTIKFEIPTLHQICVSGDLLWGPIRAHTGQRCTGV